MNQGTLVIFNVDSTVSNDELLKLFGAYGEIREVSLTCAVICAICYAIVLRCFSLWLYLMYQTI